MAELLFGFLVPPDNFLVGGDGRYANGRVMPKGSPAQSRFILMQADALAQYSIGRVRANGSIGYVSEGANGAAITRGTSTDSKLISRVHWVGVDIGSHEEWLPRAGPLAIPFRLRSIQHPMFVRARTGTGTNASQSDRTHGDY